MHQNQRRKKFVRGGFQFQDRIMAQCPWAVLRTVSFQRVLRIATCVSTRPAQSFFQSLRHRNMAGRLPRGHRQMDVVRVIFPPSLLPRIRKFRPRGKASSIELSDQRRLRISSMPSPTTHSNLSLVVTAPRILRFEQMLVFPTSPHTPTCASPIFKDHNHSSEYQRS